MMLLTAAGAHVMRRTALLVMTATAVVGCGEQASDKPIRSTFALADVCQHQTRFTTAPAAAPSTPRPTAVLEEGQKDFYTPTQMHDAPDPWHVPSAKRMQLVACAKRTDEGDRVKACRFTTGPSSVPMHEATYEVTLYEIRTGKERKTVTIRARDRRCPLSQLFRGENDLKVYAHPTPAQYVEALGDQVGSQTIEPAQAFG
jgi:hypothetical protein